MVADHQHPIPQPVHVFRVLGTQEAAITMQFGCGTGTPHPIAGGRQSVMNPASALLAVKQKARTTTNSKYFFLTS